jgi:enoyl-CoA hydratase
MKKDKTILFEGEDGGGWITLNRPESKNAITQRMMTAILNHLQDWQSNPLVKYVVIRGMGNVFSAGGDLSDIIEKFTSKQQKSDNLSGYFDEGFHVYRFINHFPKPYIAVVNGHSLGSALGLAALGSHRILTENTRIGLPEASIGIRPPIESLKHCPGKIGLYLSLTGKIIGPQDAMFCGIGTHYIPAKEIDNLLADIREAKGDEIDNIIQNYASIPEGEAPLKVNQNIIESCFNQSSIERVFEALARNDSVFAAQTLSHLKNLSPLILRNVFKFYTEVENKDIDEILNAQIQKYNHELASPETLAEFKEGLRAMFVDKDKKPRWLSSPIVY